MSNSRVEEELHLHLLVQVYIHGSIWGWILAGGSCRGLKHVLPTSNDEPSHGKPLGSKQQIEPQGSANYRNLRDTIQSGYPVQQSHTKTHSIFVVWKLMKRVGTVVDSKTQEEGYNDEGRNPRNPHYQSPVPPKVLHQIPHGCLGGALGSHSEVGVSVAGVFVPSRREWGGGGTSMNWWDISGECVHARVDGWDSAYLRLVFWN